jgi:putative GTP pyrophosphokinase
MAFATPRFQKSEVNRAGRVLCAEDPNLEEWIWAYDVLSNWRAIHGYPINTFQALLRQKLKKVSGEAIVAQRLKRTPSVLAKLRRFSTMNLAQMQDIGGLRAVVMNVARVRQLAAEYERCRFSHEFVSAKDYITNPKADGYRSLHRVYRYQNDRAPQYNGLLIELQFRSRLQHAWATAVETMSTFLGQALKSGQGERQWREFFEIASAALTFVERTPPIPGYESFSKEEVISKLKTSEGNLHVLRQLQGFSIAAQGITEYKGPGSYHLVILNSSDRTVSITPYPKTQLEAATRAYSAIEERAQKGEQLEAVLVSAGPVSALRRAYPNYFLDTHEFVKTISKVLGTNAR